MEEKSMTEIVNEAIDKSQLMTLEWVVMLLKKYPANVIIGQLEGMIADRKLVEEEKAKNKN
jgi:hypothetical protein